MVKTRDYFNIFAPTQYFSRSQKFALGAYQVLHLH